VDTHHHLRVLMRSLAVGIPFMVVGLIVPRQQAFVLFAVLLGVAAGVYAGFAMQSTSGDIALQWVAALAFASLAWLGVWWHPALIGVGWLLHAGWDLLHHRGALRTRTPPTYPLLCLYADVQWGLFVLALAVLAE
jgi:hypothetical protein